MKASKSQRKRENSRKAWKQPLAPDDELDDYTMLGSWANHLQRKLDDVSRCSQPCEDVQIVEREADIKNAQKKHGAFYRCCNKLNLYLLLNARNGLTIDAIIGELEEHPFLAVGVKEPIKIKEHFERSGKLVKHDHLSAYDYGWRTTANFSVLTGYSKHTDGQTEDGHQISHFWMKITSGLYDTRNGERNMNYLANLMCEIARFDLPYPEIFWEDGLLG